MSFNDEYLKLRKKRLEEESSGGNTGDGDIAPVREDNKWYQNFFKGSSFFEDGYQFGDVSKTAGASVADLGVDVLKGAGRLVEGLTDLAGHGIAGAADLIGQDEWAKNFRNDVNKSWVDEIAAPADEYLNKYSVLGSTSDAVGEGLGQVAGIILTGGALGAAGVGAAGITAGTTGLIGASSMGSGLSEAYLGGATDKEAFRYGALKGAIDAGTEMIFGGLGKTVKALGLSHGLSSLDDIVAKRLSSKISNRILHNLTELGVKASAEGLEEVLAGLGTAVAKKFTYMSEQDIDTLLKDENLLEQFIVGAVTSGIAQSGLVPGTRKGSFIDTVKQNQDLVTRLDFSEQTVVDKVYNDRLAEAQQNGNNLSAKEQNKLYDDILNDLEKGRIRIEDIESALGGSTTASFMVKGTKLAESYNEKARRGQAFQANVTQYEANQRDTIQKAIASGVLNNTNRTHEFVNLVAKISADKGIPFDFTNNKKLKESGFAVKGADVNAYVNKNGITLNMDSHKAWQSTVGHEITHVLEGTELYAEMQRVLFDYAKSKGDYQGRYDSLTKLYKGVDGTTIEAELTADLVGDYLFTDENFVRHLSTQNRNIFQRIYDEIKYLWKLVTAGSKEARQLEKVKHAFDKAYKESATLSTDTKYSFNREQAIMAEDLDYWETQVVEHIFNEKIAKSQKGKKRLTEAQKYDIFLKIIYDLENGNLNADTIWNVLGAENSIKKSEKIIKGNRLKESIKKRARQTINREQSYANLSDEDKMVADYYYNDALSKAENRSKKRVSSNDRDKMIDKVLKDIDKGRLGMETLETELVFKTYNDRLAKASKNGTKELSAKAKDKLYLKVLDDVINKGRINQEYIGDSWEDTRYSLSEKGQNATSQAEKPTVWEKPTNEELVELTNQRFDALVEEEEAKRGRPLSQRKKNELWFTTFAEITTEKYRDRPFSDFLKDIIQISKKEFLTKIGSADLAPFQNPTSNMNTRYSLSEEWQNELVNNAYTYWENEVVKKVYADRISKAEKGGTKQLSRDEKREIYKQVLDDLENGNLDTRTIEKVLGSKNLYNVTKNTRLMESYDRRAKGEYAVARVKLEQSLTDKERKAVNKIYNDRLAEAEQNGKKLSNNKKLKIYDEVVDDYVKLRDGKNAISHLDANKLIKERAEHIKKGEDAVERLHLEQRLTHEELVAVNNIYQERIAKAEQNGKTLSKDKKLKIYDEVLDDYVKYRSNDIAPVSQSATRYSLSEYTAAEKKAHNKAVLEHFGKTYKWDETGYLLLDGTKLDLSGKHDGAPGGYRTVDHRDITDALGYDYGGGDYSGSLVQFMSEGNIRIVPEINGLNLSVKPTKAQEQALSDFISRARGEVVLDIDDLNGNTVVSVEYPRGTYHAKVLNDIREWFDNGKQPETSGLSAFRSLTKKGEMPKRYGNYYTPLNELKIDKSVKKSTTGSNKDITFSKPLVSIRDNVVGAYKERSAEGGEVEGDLIAPIATENVTRNVVDDETGAREKRGFIDGLKKSATKARTHLVDNYSVFEDLALKTGNRELDAKANFMRYSEQRAQHFIGHGADGVRALEDLRKEVKASGLNQEFQEYMYDMHNTDRMSLEKRAKSMLRKFGNQFKELKPEQVKAIAAKTITPETSAKTAQTIREAREYLNLLELKNKPVRGENYTAEISQANVARLEALHPQFKEWAQDIYKINDFLREKLVEDGEISRETADLWAKIYPHYVPIRRLDNSGAAVGEQYIQQTGLTEHLDEGNNTGVNAPIKRATGGSSDIDDLFRTLAMRVEQTYKAGAKNRFGLELKDTLATTINRSQASFDEMVDGVETHEERLKKGENGTKSTFTVFENGERVEFEITDEMYEALQPANDLFSGTSKVLNAATKFQKDVLTQYNPFFTMRNIVKDTQDVFINSQHAAKTYAKMPTAVSELIKHARGKSTKWAKEYFENGGEQNTYFDGQELSFKKEDGVAKKTLGFIPRKISEASNFVERVPRLAEYIASREAGKSIEGAMLDSARVTTNFAAGGDVTKWANRNGVTFLNASIQGAAQQVRNVREAKANGLKGMITLGAKFVAAGLPFVLLNSLMWDDDDDYEELSDYVKENYYIVAKYGDGQFVRIPKGRAMAVIQNAFEQMKNLVTGDDEVDLERFGQLLVENLAPNNPFENNVFAPVMDAFDNKTWYGDDLVPTRLQDLPAAEQYDETTDSISKWLGENTDTSPYKWNYLLDQYSGVFGDMLLPMLTPQAESGDNSLVGNMIAPLRDQFTTDSVLKNQNVSDFYDTVDELAKNANSRYATDEDILKYKYMNSVSADLRELYTQKREIQNSNLSDDEKYQAVRDIQKQIDELTENSLNAYNNIRYFNGYAIVGGKFYNTYATDLQNITSDKDANGKTITNSRKEKVADYINNLNIPYGDKIILYKSEYKGDDTYNAEIVDYLNNRDDISYEEMVTILHALGFTVKGDRATWD